jgi:tRNA 2-thiouridine synthesizing protein A
MMPPVKTLDTKGELCPMPVVMTGAAIHDIGVGDQLEVLSTDPAATPDFVAWAKMTGHKLVSTSEDPGSPPVYRFVIERTR